MQNRLGGFKGSEHEITQSIFAGMAKRGAIEFGGVVPHILNPNHKPLDDQCDLATEGRN